MWRVVGVGVAFNRGYEAHRLQIFQAYSVLTPMNETAVRAFRLSTCIFVLARCGTSDERFKLHMGGCQNYGPFLDPCYNTAPHI